MSFFTLNLAQNVLGAIFSNDSFEVYPYVTPEMSYGYTDNVELRTILLEQNNKVLRKTFDTKYSFNKIAILDVEVQNPSKIMTTPVEDGRFVADSKIIMPKRAVVKIGLPSSAGDDYLAVLSSAISGVSDIVSGKLPSPLYEKVMTGIKYAYDDSIPFNIKTKTELLQNMILTGYPHKFTVDTLYRVILTLEFEEVIVVKQVETFKSAQDSFFKKVGNVISKKFSGALSKIGL
jgi:hypothetical protein